MCSRRCCRLPEERYATTEQVTAFLQPLLVRVKALPGVVYAAASTAMPPFNTGGESTIEIAGTAPDGKWRTVFQQVTAEYFPALGLELKAGRPFSEADVNDVRKVAIVNETFVRKYLTNDDPLGRRVRLANLQQIDTVLDTRMEPVRDTWFEVVGVVGDVTNRGPRAPTEPEVLIPSTIARSVVHVLIVRTSQDPATLTNAVRREVSATDPGVPLIRPATLEAFISQQLYAGPRFGFLLMTVFGSVGLILVTVGVYSVLAYSTTEKTHEIGIRMALGAKSTDVLEMIVRSGLRPVVAGLAVGLTMSTLVGRVLGTQLVGVTMYRPADACGNDTAADDHRSHRLLDSRAESGARRPVGRAALRIADARKECPPLLAPERVDRIDARRSACRNPGGSQRCAAEQHAGGD